MELTNQEQSLLAFQVGPFRLCVQATEAESILELPVIHTIPLTPPSIAGMFIYRDRVATAVDVSRKLGLLSESDNARSQLIIAPLGEDIYGFLVDTVHELIPTEKIHWNSMHGIAKIEAFEHFGVLDEDIILFTSFESVLNMKEIPPEDESLRSFIKSNSSMSEQSTAEAHSQSETTADEESVSVEGSLKAPKAGEISLSPDKSKTDKDINENETVSDDFAESACLTEDSTTDIPDDAVTEEEIRAFNNQEKKDDSIQKKSSSNLRQPAQGTPQSQPKRQDHHPRPSQYNTSNTYQQSQARPSASTYEDESSFADYFTKKVLISAGAIIIILSAAILFLRSGGEESAEGVNIASVGIESSRLQAEPAESAPVNIEQEEPEPVAEVESPIPESPDPQPEPVSESADEPESSREILRVDTDDFTLTIERGDRAESSPVQDNENISTAGNANNQTSGNVNPPPERQSEYALSGKIDTEQKQPISEPLAANVENSSSTIEPSKPPATQPPEVEYVHVVKKGDTLWKISKQYLGNPLRYPELARLSRISDPDWIYPGDVVRIRKK